MIPAEIYAAMLHNLPPKEFYVPLNLRKWVRADGTSTRDQFYLPIRPREPAGIAARS
jgi:hypothetical protein